MAFYSHLEVLQAFDMKIAPLQAHCSNYQFGIGDTSGKVKHCCYHGQCQQKHARSLGEKSQHLFHPVIPLKYAFMRDSSSRIFCCRWREQCLIARFFFVYCADADLLCRCMKHKQVPAGRRRQTLLCKGFIYRKACAFLRPTRFSSRVKIKDRWPSGRRRTPGKCVGGQPSPGFESLSVRHISASDCFSLPFNYP